MLAVGGLPVFNVVVVKFYINCMVAINRCMIVLVLILIYTSLTVNYSYLRIIRLTKEKGYYKGIRIMAPNRVSQHGLLRYRTSSSKRITLMLVSIIIFTMHLQRCTT